LFDWIEEEFARAVHVFELNAVCTKEVCVALVRYRINAVLAIFGSFAVNIGWRFASFSLLRKLKSVGTPLVGKLDAIGTLIESVASSFDTVKSVFTRCLRRCL